MHFPKSLLSKYYGTFALAMSLSVSLGWNVYLARQLRARRGTVEEYPIIKSGTKLQTPLVVVDAAGRSTQMSFDGPRPTVIYVFSPLCEWCRKNEANIKALVVASGSRFHFCGLSVTSTGLKNYIAQGHAPFPVYALQSTAEAVKMGFSVTPETIVVGRGGQVQRVWSGAYTGQNEKAVAEYFNARLPGLRTIASVSH